MATTNTPQLVDDLVEAFFYQASLHLGQPVDRVLAEGSPDLAITAIAAAFASYDGRDLWSTPFGKAAAMLIYLNRNHPLRNGVKRSSFSMVDYYLDKHDYVIEVDPMEGERFMIDVALGLVSVEQATEWLKMATNRKGLLYRITRIVVTALGR